MSTKVTFDEFIQQAKVAQSFLIHNPGVQESLEQYRTMAQMIAFAQLAKLVAYEHKNCAGVVLMASAGGKEATSEPCLECAALKVIAAEGVIL